MGVKTRLRLDGDFALLALFFVVGVGFIAFAISQHVPWGIEGGSGVLLVGFSLYAWRHR